MIHDYFNIRFLFIVLFIGVTANANAQGSTTPLAKQFVDLLRYKDQFKKYHEECLISQRTFSPEALISQDTDYFGGIRPGSPKWPAIVAAYDSYALHVCSRPTENDFLSAITVSYAEAMSAGQLKDAIKFYSSPAGQVLVAANMHALKTVYELSAKINGEEIVEANAQLQKVISNLLQPK